jgi:proton-translocating NADH-quinone oxidoreductase chain N
MFELEISYLLLAFLAVYIISAIVTVFTKTKKAQGIASTALLAAMAASSMYLLASNYSATILNLVHLDPFSLLFVMLFSVAMMLVNILAFAYSKDYVNLSLLISFSTAGFLIVATANSIISIFLGLEFIAVTTAFMMLFEGKHRIEAAVKFFILSSISIAIFSFGLALLFPYSPQLALAPIAQIPSVDGAYFVLLSMIMFIVALGFDTSLFPFNLWVPDVYEGSPTYVTAMLAGINKKVAFVALMEVLFVAFFPYRAEFSSLLAVLAVLTMFFGNILALSQKSVKRMFAYSSIAQAGYILIGLASATQFGIEASIFYIIAHSFMIIGVFAIVLWLGSKNIRTIDEYSALNSRNGFAAIALTMFMLSMAGIPPLIGFAGKFLLFSSALDANIALLAVFGVINSFISIYYYARVINAMYSKKDERKLRNDTYVAVVVIIALAVVVIFGIYPQPLIALASNASKALLGI